MGAFIFFYVKMHVGLRKTVEKMKYLLIILVLLMGCRVYRLPKERIRQASLYIDYTFLENEVNISLKNPLRCPARVWMKSNNPRLDSLFALQSPLLLKALSDTLIRHPNFDSANTQIFFSGNLGDPSRKIEVSRVELPFPKNRQYKLIQGYNSKPTHNLPSSKYALDFGLKIGDTICAATGGFVVGVVEGYKYGGEGKKWNPYGNFITIYEAESGLYTQYVHLTYMGSFVELGDSVSVGQAIGLSGMTGQTNIEHLHFNCFRPDDSSKGMLSIPLDSIGPYPISSFKRYEWVNNPK